MKAAVVVLAFGLLAVAAVYAAEDAVTPLTEGEIDGFAQMLVDEDVAKGRGLLQSAKKKLAYRRTIKRCNSLHGPQCLTCGRGPSGRCFKVADPSRYALLRGRVVQGPGYEPGRGGARACRAGYRKPSAGKYKCFRCRSRRYQPRTGQRSCLTCSSPRTTNAARTSCSLRPTKRPTKRTPTRAPTRAPTKAPVAASPPLVVVPSPPPVVVSSPPPAQALSPPPAVQAVAASSPPPAAVVVAPVVLAPPPGGR